jgi:hypothetical protein
MKRILLAISLAMFALMFSGGAVSTLVGVRGPTSSTDNAIPRFDGTDGGTLQGSGVSISDTNVVSAAGQFQAYSTDNQLVLGADQTNAATNSRIEFHVDGAAQGRFAPTGFQVGLNSNSNLGKLAVLGDVIIYDSAPAPTATDYERVRVFWNGNKATFQTQNAGTGVATDIALTPATGVLDAVAVTNFQLSKTITAAGTTGAQTINKASGSVNFAASAASLVVTNSMVTTSSVIICTIATNDATMTSVQVVAASGSFTIYPNAAPTAETRVNFLVTN